MVGIEFFLCHEITHKPNLIVNLNQSVGVSGVERRWSQTSTSGLIYQLADGRFVTSPRRNHHHLSIRRVKSFFLPSFAGAGGGLRVAATEVR